MKGSIKLVGTFILLIIKSMKKYLVKYWEYIAIFILVFLLKDYYFYYKELRLAKEEVKPWKWQTYRYRNSLFEKELLKENIIHDRTITDPLKNEILKTEQPLTSTKLIIFSLPAFNEEIPYPVDQDKCGGKCVVSYNTSMLNAAQAVIFHIYDERPVPPRK